MHKKRWWKEAVAYQIYPRSFNDSDGDGIGDIQGIIDKLDYLKYLGINLIWICPIFASPNDDNGYDISDYQAIHPEFGTMEDMDRLLHESHKRGMKLILDLVINHTSDEHHWFIESRSAKDNPYRDYYIWHPGKSDGSPPNNWQSIFSGSVWEYDSRTEEYYMHVFSKKQPDLNWENKEVRNRLYQMVNWWLDKGIDGFRVDAISHIKKLPGLPDLPNPNNKPYVNSMAGHRNQPGIDSFLSELAQETFNKYDIVTVGEANGVWAEDAHEWVNEKSGYFDMIFQFEHLNLWGDKSVFDLVAFKRILSKWQKALEKEGWNALYNENHDLVRSVSSIGDPHHFHLESAKALAMMYFYMKGTPFIYQGQEIGMTNVQFEKFSDYDDIQSINKAKVMVQQGSSPQEAMQYMWKSSRDNVRTPMQWDDTKNAGFTSGRPWLKVNENYKAINVKNQINDPDSILNFYKRMIQIRKDSDTLIYGAYQLIYANDPHLFAYLRQSAAESYLILTNLSEQEKEVDLREYKLLELVQSNYKVEDKSQYHFFLKPFEARLYRVDYLS